MGYYHFINKRFADRFGVRKFSIRPANQNTIICSIKLFLKDKNRSGIACNATFVILCKLNSELKKMMSLSLCDGHCC